jgi:3-hydroxyacyl-CoA dehydrogenase
MKIIQKIAVLGTGVMGGQIAAHLSNAGYKVYAYDMTQEVSEKGIEFTRKIKPNAFYNPKSAELITPMNYDEHLNKIADCDWILEAITERLDWKLAMYERVIPYLKDDAILTSNTSGISTEELAEKLPDSLKKRFFITHFFNPPRYMKLVEVIPNTNTDNKYIDMLIPVLEDTLGKGVVHANDTPNFIANRIGVYGMMVTLREAKKRNLSIEDVDGLTGSLIGHPKSATFRTADVVGLDTLAFVAKNAFDKCVDDTEREIFDIPDYLKTILDNGWLGQKSGQGFYKKISKGKIHSLDLNTLEYSPQEKKRFTGVRLARQNINLKKKIKTLTWSKDIAGEFTWEVFSKTLIYSANQNGVISNDLVNIDRAMRWGFGWDLGPFEIWDAIGLAASIERMKSEGRSIPDWIERMLKNGHTSFYRYSNGALQYYDKDSEKYQLVSTHKKEISFRSKKATNQVIKKNWSASIVDLGEGIAGVEFHSVLKPELNPIDGSVIETLQYANHWVQSNGYKGLVISGDAAHFSAGANLNLILNASMRKDWDSIIEMTASMQQVLQGLKYSPFPVVAAPFGMTLGGGFEIIGASNRIIASAELYCGLVEVGVGLIPGSGGNLRMLSNISKRIKSPMPGAFPVVQKVFETVGFAKISSSAKEAMALGYLQKEDRIILNRNHLLWEARQTAIDLSKDFVSPKEETFKLPGVSGRLVVESSIKGFLKSGKISEHDALIAKKLAFVLTGGKKGGPFTPVSEQYLLDIEREAFISLCGEKKTLERIQFMLTKGKPLRN